MPEQPDYLDPQSTPQAQQPPKQNDQVSLEDFEEMARQKYGVPKNLVQAMTQQESGGSWDRTSPTGVKGKYQVTEATARQYGLDRNDPFQQTVAAMKHLRAQYDALGDIKDNNARWLSAVGRYYGGSNAVDAQGRISTDSPDGVSNPLTHMKRVANNWKQLGLDGDGDGVPDSQQSGQASAPQQKQVRPQARQATPPAPTPSLVQQVVGPNASKSLISGVIAQDQAQTKQMSQPINIGANPKQQVYDVQSPRQIRQQYQDFQKQQALESAAQPRRRKPVTPTTQNTARSVVGNFGQGVVEGVLNAPKGIVAQAASGLNSLAQGQINTPEGKILAANAQGMVPAYEEATAPIQEAANSYLPVNPQDQSLLTAKLPRMAGGIVPLIATTALTRGKGTAGAFSLEGAYGMGLQNAAGAYDDAIANGASEEDALKAAQQGFASGATTGSVGLGATAAKIGIQRPLSERALEVAHAIGQNVAQTVANNATAQNVGYDPNRSLLQGTGEAALTGGLLSAGMHALNPRSFGARVPEQDTTPVDRQPVDYRNGTEIVPIDVAEAAARDTALRNARQPQEQVAPTATTPEAVQTQPAAPAAQGGAFSQRLAARKSKLAQAVAPVQESAPSTSAERPANVNTSQESTPSASVENRSKVEILDPNQPIDEPAGTRLRRLNIDGNEVIVRTPKGMSKEAAQIITEQQVRKGAQGGQTSPEPIQSEARTPEAAPATETNAQLTQTTEQPSIRPAGPPVEPNRGNLAESQAVPNETERVNATKEPWQMTRSEFITSRGANAPVESDEFANYHLSKVPAGKPGLSVEGNKVVYRNEKGEPVGVTTLETAAGEKVVNDTAVRPDSRRQGIATKLYDEAARLGHKNGWVENEASASVKHKMAVKSAIAEGRPVPAEVLADYPDLAKRNTNASEQANAFDKTEQSGTLAETPPANSETRTAAPVEAGAKNGAPVSPAEEAPTNVSRDSNVPAPEAGQARPSDVYSRHGIDLAPEVADAINKRHAARESEDKGNLGKLGEFSRKALFRTGEENPDAAFAAHPVLRKLLGLPKIPQDLYERSPKDWATMAQHTMDALAHEVGAPRSSRIDEATLNKVGELLGSRLNPRNPEHRNLVDVYGQTRAAVDIAHGRVDDLFADNRVRSAIEAAQAHVDSGKPLRGAVRTELKNALIEAQDRINKSQPGIQGQSQADVTELTNHAISEFITDLSTGRLGGDPKGWLAKQFRDNYAKSDTGAAREPVRPTGVGSPRATEAGETRTAPRSRRTPVTERSEPTESGSRNAAEASATDRGNNAERTGQERGVASEKQSADRTTANQERQDNVGKPSLTNPDGSPKILSHGTSDATFDKFDVHKSKHGLFGMGVYLTEDPEMAATYTKKGRGKTPGVINATLDAKNWMDMDAPVNEKFWRSIPDLADADFSHLKTNEDAYRALEDEYRDQNYSYDEARYSIFETLQEKGLDALTHVGGGRVNSEGKQHRVWIALDPDAVHVVPKSESATPRTGTPKRDTIVNPLDEEAFYEQQRKNQQKAGQKAAAPANQEVFTRDEITVGKPRTSRRKRGANTDGETRVTVEAPFKVSKQENWSQVDSDKLKATVEARVDFASGRVAKKSDPVWSVWGNGKDLLANNLTYEDAIKAAKDHVYSANLSEAERPSQNSESKGITFGKQKGEPESGGTTLGSNLGNAFDKFNRADIGKILDHLKTHGENFVGWAKAMIQDFGEQIRPYLRSMYNGARDFVKSEEGTERFMEAGQRMSEALDKFKKATGFESNSEYNTRKSREQVENSPEFKKWFGDSKVVDENGKPLVVYHGTDSVFDAFNPKKMRERRYGKGFYFSTSPEDAAAYGKIVMPVYLRIDDLRDMSNRISSPSIGNGKHVGFKIGKITAGGGDVYMVKDPKSIKSVFNRGTFDSSNPNISHDLGSATAEAVKRVYRGAKSLLSDERGSISADGSKLPSQEELTNQAKGKKAAKKVKENIPVPDDFDIDKFADTIDEKVKSLNLDPKKHAKAVALFDDIFDAVDKNDGVALAKAQGELKETLQRKYIGVADLLRPLNATMELSVVGRQGYKGWIEHPLSSWKAFSGAAKSEHAGMEFLAKMRNDPDVKLQIEAGGDLAMLNEINLEKGALSREENITGRWPEKIPIAGKGIGWLERFNKTFIEGQRIQLFKQGLGVIERNGGSKYTTNADGERVPSDAVKTLARHINMLTGRGDLSPSRRVQAAADLLSVGFYSPRFTVSNFQAINPVRPIQAMIKTPEIGRQIALDYVKRAALVVGAVGALKAAGFEVPLDPDDPDFLKAKFGKFKVPLAQGGMQPAIKYTFRMMKRAYEIGSATARGNSNESGRALSSAFGQTGQFLRQKESPVAGLIHDQGFARKDYTDSATQEKVNMGTNAIGQPVSFGRDLAQHALPMYILQVIEAGQNGGAGVAAGTAIPEFVGLGTGYYESGRYGQNIPDNLGKTRLKRDWSYAQSGYAPWNEGMEPLNRYETRVKRADALLEESLPNLRNSPSYQSADKETQRKMEDTLNRRIQDLSYDENPSKSKIAPTAIVASIKSSEKRSETQRKKNLRKAF